MMKLPEYFHSFAGKVRAISGRVPVLVGMHQLGRACTALHPTLIPPCVQLPSNSHPLSSTLQSSPR